MTGPRHGYELAKRVFDVTVSGIALVLLAPLMLSIALAIRLTSHGPILYRGTRIGLHGQPFAMFKFRTMRPDAERSGTTTVLDDPRITWIGRALRRFKLDELPQLFNVLRGEMSLVGPRPEVEEHTSAYTTDEQAILTVLPGITDYASIHFVSLDAVLGRENPHEVFVTRIRSQKNQLRLEYVRRRSFIEDLRILARTVRAVAGKARRTPADG